MEKFGYTSAMRKYVQFSGRAPRMEYWMFILVYTIIIIFAAVVDGVVLGESDTGTGILATIVILGHFLPGLAVTIRRLHDIGKSGWWFLIAFIPLIGSLILLYFTIKKSEPGTNTYGPNPYGVADPAVFE